MPKNNDTPKTNNKRGTYRRFDGPIKLMRRSEIRGYAIRYLDNVAENNGKCKHGFMAGLVREASSENNALQINSRDIETEVARIVAEQRKVSPELSGTELSEMSEKVSALERLCQEKQEIIIDKEAETSFLYSECEKLNVLLDDFEAEFSFMTKAMEDMEQQYDLLHQEKISNLQQESTTFVKEREIFAPH